jgi:hypothetical protein
MRWDFVLLVASFADVQGCDPGFRLAGSVSDAAGRPVVGADVRIECATTFAETTSDSAGRFGVHRTGWCPDTCTLEVRSAAHATWTARVQDHCTKRPGHLRDACLDVEADVVLF